MVKVKRISPEEDVTLEITATPEEWNDVLRVLGANVSISNSDRPYTANFFNGLERVLRRGHS